VRLLTVWRIKDAARRGRKGELEGPFSFNRSLFPQPTRKKKSFERGEGKEGGEKDVLNQSTCDDGLFRLRKRRDRVDIAAEKEKEKEKEEKEVRHAPPREDVPAHSSTISRREVSYARRKGGEEGTSVCRAKKLEREKGGIRVFSQEEGNARGDGGIAPPRLVSFRRTFAKGKGGISC